MLYVTNCSGGKIPQIEAVTPDNLYMSVRVWYLKQLAEEKGYPWAILSGEYGLVFGDDKVCTYDTLLADDEKAIVSKGELVAKQLKEHGVDSVRFYLVPDELESGRAVNRYLSVMQYACNKLSITLEEVPFPKPTSTRKPVPVEPQYIPSTYHMDKTLPNQLKTNKEAQMFVLKAQDEKGLWQNVRKSSFLPDLQIKARMLVAKFPNQKVEIVEEPRDAKLPF